MNAGQRHLEAAELVELIDARYAALLLYARSWNVDAAEDIVQDALMKLVDETGKKGRPPNPVAWLFKTVRNEAISRFRKVERRRKHETEAARLRPDWFSSGDNGVFSREAAEKLGELPADQREVVVLRIWSQLSFEEIAELTALPKTNVFRLYTEALAELRRKLSR